MDVIGRSYMFITSDSLTVKMKTPKSFSSHNGDQNRQTGKQADRQTGKQLGEWFLHHIQFL